MSKGEEEFSMQIESFGLPPPIRQHKFSLINKRWAFDFAWHRGPLNASRIALEVDGGTWGKSSHGYGAQYERQCERGMHAGLEGWLVIRVTPAMVRSGVALSMLAYTLEQKGWRW